VPSSHFGNHGDISTRLAQEWYIIWHQPRILISLRNRKHCHLSNLLCLIEISRHKRGEMRWDEMRWDEMRWDDTASRSNTHACSTVKFQCSRLMFEFHHRIIWLKYSLHFLCRYWQLEHKLILRPLSLNYSKHYSLSYWWMLGFTEFDHERNTRFG
jgi:hypothetical protein